MSKVSPERVEWDEILRKELQKKDGIKIAVHFQGGEMVEGIIRIKAGEIFVDGKKLDKQKLIGLYREIY